MLVRVVGRSVDLVVGWLLVDVELILCLLLVGLLVTDLVDVVCVIIPVADVLVG